MAILKNVLSVQPHARECHRWQGIEEIAGNSTDSIIFTARGTHSNKLPKTCKYITLNFNTGAFFLCLQDLVIWCFPFCQLSPLLISTPAPRYQYLNVTPRMYGEWLVQCWTTQKHKWVFLVLFCQRDLLMKLNWQHRISAPYVILAVVFAPVTWSKHPTLPLWDWASFVASS